MSWLKNLFGRKEDHAEWLKKHPGKGAPKAPPPAMSAEDAQGTRDRMEAEMTAAKDKRENVR